MNAVHRVTFKGAIDTSWRAASGPRLVVAEKHLEDVLRINGFVDDTAAAVYRAARPSAPFVEELGNAVRADDITEVVAVGSGALLDAAKLAYRIGSNTQDLALVLVPCGAEPYRAVTAFAVVDDEDGTRPTAVDPDFAAAEVLLIEELLATVPPHVLAVHALDTAVQAIESLLSLRVNPLARTLAGTALQIVAQEVLSDGHPTAESRTRLTLASFLAAEAFTSTRLGIAHALASPLGAEVGITHDTINGILGEPMVALWGADVDGFSDVAEAFSVAPTVPDVLEVLASIRRLAQLPSSLAELGIAWASVEAVLPKAARSSGISVLARPAEEGMLEDFAQRAWRTAPEREVLDATTT